MGAPIESLVGGVSLGILSVGRLLIHRKIFGISGNVRGLLRAPTDISKAALVAGLIVGGVVLRVIAPASFGRLPDTFPTLRAAIAGSLVGSGAALANGCTSGHGICGLARLSPRSLAFVCVMMATGALTARLSSTLAALGGGGARFPTIELPGLPRLVPGVALLAADVAVLFAVSSRLASTTRPATKTASTDRPNPPDPTRERIADFAEGALFSLSLGFAGMTDPRNVAAFLDMRLSGFDYSLAFVMGGAVLTAVIPFQRAFRAKGGGPLPKPPGHIDGRLLAGGALFGAGWGLAGLCPGPALAALPTLKAPILAFNAAACVALYIVP